QALELCARSIFALERIKIFQLVGIGLEIVELGLGSFDELGMFFAQGAQGSPSPAQGIVGFPKELAGRLSFCVNERNKRFAVQFRWRGCVGQRKDGGQNVGGADQGVEDHAVMGCAGHFDDEWNMESGIVEKEAVGVFSVLAEALAVVADNNNDCVLVGAGLLESGDEVAEREVGVGDLAVVEVLRVLLRKGRGRFVRIVGIEEMDPHEAWS